MFFFGGEGSTTVCDALKVWLLGGVWLEKWVMILFLGMGVFPLWRWGGIRPKTKDPPGVSEVLFNEVLAEISKLSRAIVFLDECEGIFRSRGPMMNYASVSVTAKVDVIDDFLAWVDGLEMARGKKMQLGLLWFSVGYVNHFLFNAECLQVNMLEVSRIFTMRQL